MLPGLFPTINPPRCRATFLAQLTAQASDVTVNYGNVTVPTPGLVVAVAGHIGTSAGGYSIIGFSIGGTTVPTHAATAGTSGAQSACGSRVVATTGATNISVQRSSGGSTGDPSAVTVYLLTGYLSTTPTGSMAFKTSASVTSLGSTFAVTANGAAFYQTVKATSNATTWNQATLTAQTTITGGTARVAAASTQITVTQSSKVASNDFAASSRCAITGVAFR